MQTYNIFTNAPDTLPEGKADFLLVASDEDVENAQYLLNETTPSEIETKALIPTLITRAVHNLSPYSSIEIFNVNAGSEARELFSKAREAGNSYELKGNYLILAVNISSKLATTVISLLSDTTDKRSTFEKLQSLENHALLFCAGFILEASRRFHIVLTGGLTMAACLLIADKLREDVLMRVKHANLTLATTHLQAQDRSLNFKHILEQLSYSPHAIYTTFDFSTSEISLLREYKGKEEKQEMDIGASFCYASKNNVTNEKLLEQIEFLLYLL